MSLHLSRALHGAHRRHQPNLPPRDSGQVKNRQNPKEPGQLDEEGDRGSVTSLGQPDTIERALPPWHSGSLGVSLAFRSVSSSACTRQGGRGSQKHHCGLEGQPRGHPGSGSGSLRDGCPVAVFWRRHLFTVMTGFGHVPPRLWPFTQYSGDSSHPSWQCCETHLIMEEESGGGRRQK